MKIVEFSVTNYRSITKAHKIKLDNLTVLVGKNNEGKSNILRALNVAMRAIIKYSDDEKEDNIFNNRYRREVYYDWERDFPIQFQRRKNHLESIFRLNFRLESNELEEFRNETHIQGNEDIPICVKIDNKRKINIDVPKRGSPAYKKKSREITKFVSKRIIINYIQAIRTDEMAMEAIYELINGKINQLYHDDKYYKAIRSINDMRKEILLEVSEQIIKPLQSFIPNIKNVEITQRSINSYMMIDRRVEDIIIDDGVATSIRNKGDGVKSLITLSLLKNKNKFNGVSVIAIEEPEAYLHSGAIHSIVDVINNMSLTNQVIITTHNPLFVMQNRLESNIIVDNGTARAAKNISEIRDILGVWPSDNLRTTMYVVVVEGNDDRIALQKILSSQSERIRQALNNNKLSIKALGGASNLKHELNNLKYGMFKYLVLLDYDKAGKDAVKKAEEAGLIKPSEYRFTVCNGKNEAEFEDCLNPNIYKSVLENTYNIKYQNIRKFLKRNKWSDGMKNAFFSSGLSWTDKIEKDLKCDIAESIPSDIKKIEDVWLTQKATFLSDFIDLIEEMLDANTVNQNNSL